MKKFYLPTILLIFACVFIVKTTDAQSWFREGFDVVFVPADTTPIGWSQLSLAGTVGFPNGFKRAINSNYPTVGPGGFIGPGFIKYNNRNASYPATGNWCSAGDQAQLVSPPLDWRSRTSTSNGWISIRFYRENSITGGVHLVNDNIEVYLNDHPDLLNAVLLTETTSGSTAIPRPSVMAPAGTANAWNLLQYHLPLFGAYAMLDTSSTVYLIIKANCGGGNNMYIDSVNVPTYPLINAIESLNPDKTEALNLFPNPANGLVYIQSQNSIDVQAQISVSDLSSRKINVDINRINAQTFQLNTHLIENGSYTVIITSGKLVLTKRLVVSK